MVSGPLNTIASRVRERQSLPRYHGLDWVFSGVLAETEGGQGTAGGRARTRATARVPDRLSGAWMMAST
jgi:hypothetical protein